MNSSTFFKTIFKTILLLIITAVVAGLLLAACLIYVFEKGPSKEIRDLFVVTVSQSSAAKPLAGLFLSDETVSEILQAATAEDDDMVSDENLVVIDEDKPVSDDIVIEDVVGPTYNGKMMIIADPSRVYVYTIPDYSAEKGMKLSEIVKKEGAIAGVNGGGFEDENGQGNGAVPTGIVMSKGKFRFGDKNTTYKLIGLDKNNKLVVGKMTGSKAISLGIRDAVSWGPALIVNGKPVKVGNAGGLNPRTAIGQREDGAILLLVIDGRQPNSMGAGYRDLIGIMQSYGAVNAANLDGGNSTAMIYDGEILNTPAGLGGLRRIPTAILVEAR